MAVARRHGQPPAASSTSTNLARQLHDRRRYPCSLREYSVVRRPPASSNASLHNVARGNRRCQGYATAAALVRCKWPMWHRERAAGYWRLGIVRGPERRRCPNRATYGSRTAPAALGDGRLMAAVGGAVARTGRPSVRERPLLPSTTGYGGTATTVLPGRSRPAPTRAGPVGATVVNSAKFRVFQANFRTSRALTG